MNYREVKLPAGLFRMYEDRPNVWVEVPQNDGYTNWVERGWALTNKENDNGK